LRLVRLSTCGGWVWDDGIAMRFSVGTICVKRRRRRRRRRRSFPLRL
jgi:hypothetical protein